MSVAITTKAAWNADDYILHLNQCIEWIVFEGIEVPKSSRYFQYLNLLKEMNNLNKRSKHIPHGGHNHMHDMLNAMREIREIDRIRRYFSVSKPEGFQTKLENVVSGPPHFNQEKDNGGKSAHSRNIFLELLIGTQFIKQGFEIKYGNNSFPEPLVVSGSNQCPCECKRLQKLKASSVRRNITKAIKQINSHFRAESTQRNGIIVLDISKAINPKGAVLIDIDKSGGRQKSVADLQFDNFVEGHVYCHDWQEYPWVCGILLFASYMTINSLKQGSPFSHKYVSRTRAITLNETSWFMPELAMRQREVPSRGKSSENYEEFLN